MPAQSKTTAQKKMTVKVVKPFCKVCHDAGKPESEYTSHFVRSDTGPKSKVICPTLLAQECRYCCKNGHTVKFCPLLTEQKKIETKTAKKGEEVNKPIIKKHKKKQNAFEVLDFESDEEKEVIITTNTVSKVEEPEKPKKDEFPSLSSKSGSISAVPVLTGYANIAAKTRSQFEAEQKQMEVEKYEKEMIERSIKGAKQAAKKEVPFVKKSWADCDRDDDEEDLVILSTPAPWISYKKAEEIVDETW
jgi:hypothetical protein